MAKYNIIPSSRVIVRQPISIGHKAEKGVEAVEFDVTAWVETYGSGTLTVIMRRWGDAIPYPIALEIDENNKATWTLSDIDTAKAGMAYAQLNYIVGDEVVKKSDIYTFRVMDSLTGEGEPPEAYESWLEHLTHLAAEAMAEVLDIEGIVTDKTLTVDGGIADAKAAGDALALKADKSTTYTKTEVDQMIEDVEVETDTTLAVSGAPADAKKTGDELTAIKADLDSVTEDLSDATSAIKAITITGIDVLSLTNATPGTPKKLSVKITATQAGSGTPSPTNVRTISGKSTVNLSISDGTETDEHEIALGQTVYGGELDLISGVLTITEAGYDLSQLTWSYQDSVKAFYKAPSAFNPPVLEYASSIAGYYGISDTYEIKGYSAMTGASVTYAMSQRNESSVKRIYVRTDGTNAVTPTGHAVFRLKTPIEVQLTPEEIELFTGYNLITTEGEITLEYVPNYSSLFEEQAEIWNAINADDLTPYYVAEMEDTIEKVQKEWDSPALVFLNTTDMHMYSSNANGVQNHQQMFKNMRWLCKQCKVDFALNLGDLTDGTSTQDVTLERGYEATRGFLSLGVPYYFANGNHDTNYAYSGHPYLFTMAENVKAYYGASRGTKYNVSESGTDFYVDFDWTDTRLIILNANNVDEALEYSYGTTTAQWFANEALNTNKHVILAVHQSPINTQVYNNINTDFASAIISAVNTFIGNGGDLIMLSGHSHLDVAFVSPWLSVMQDCHRFSQTYGEEATPESGDEHGISGYVGSIIKNARTQGDYTEDLWSVCVYKPDVSELSMIRFGAGADRYFHFAPISPTTVTSKLSGTLTWSTSDATVATVSGGVITGVGTGRCGILAKDADGNYECWIVVVN